MTTTEQRNKRVVKIADAAMMVDIDTGEILAEREKPHPVSQPAVAPKKAAEKLPYNAVIIEGTACPDCGGNVANARMNGSRFEVCMKQFSEEPECWYAREVPKDGDKVKASDDGDADAEVKTAATGGDAFYDGGADLGGAQMKTAFKTEGDADTETASTTKKGKGKK